MNPLSYINGKHDAYEQACIRFTITNHTLKGLMWLNKNGVSNPIILTMIDFTLGSVCSIIEKIVKTVMSFFNGIFYISINLGRGSFGKVFDHLLFDFLVPPLLFIECFTHVFFGYKGYCIATTPHEEIQKKEKQRIEAACKNF